MKNPIREQWIKSWSVEYDYGFILIKKIDWEKSLHNQARMGQPLIPELVTRYIEAIKGGAEFPPVTVYLSSTGEYVIIDGNHRVSAIKATGGDKVQAYIVNIADALLVEMMTRSANVQMGQPPSFTEAKEHAKIVVTKLGLNRDEAARRFGISRSVLDTALRVDEVDAVLVSLNHDPEKLSLTSRDILNQIKDNYPVLQGAFNLAVDAKLTSAQIREMIQNIKSGHNEEDQLSLLASYTEAEGIETRIKGISPRKKESGKVWGMLTRILNLEKDSVVEYGITSTTDLLKFQDRTRQSIATLNKLLEDAIDKLP